MCKPFSGHSWSGKRDWDGASKLLTFSGTASYMSPLKSLLRPTRLFFYSFSIHVHLYHPLTPHKQVGKVNIKLYMIRSDNILCHIKEACPFWPFCLGKSIFRHYFSLKNSNLISKYFTALSNPILASFFLDFLHSDIMNRF